MDVLTSETWWALNNEIIKQVTSSWSLFIKLSRWCTVQYTYNTLNSCYLNKHNGDDAPQKKKSAEIFPTQLRQWSCYRIHALTLQIRVPVTANRGTHFWHNLLYLCSSHHSNSSYPVQIPPASDKGTNCNQCRLPSTHFESGHFLGNHSISLYYRLNSNNTIQWYSLLCQITAVRLSGSQCAVSFYSKLNCTEHRIDCRLVTTRALPESCYKLHLLLQLSARWGPPSSGRFWLPSVGLHIPICNT